jgi:hypothetical protein
MEMREGEFQWSASDAVYARTAQTCPLFIDDVRPALTRTGRVALENPPSTCGR